ncbi:MAG: hypothetical protein ACLVES_05770 [Faecalibacterium prausnitzii]
MCLLYAVYAADVVATAVAACRPDQELDALETVADSMHAVSDAHDRGRWAPPRLEADQQMDESRPSAQAGRSRSPGQAADRLSPPVSSWPPCCGTMRRRGHGERPPCRRDCLQLNAAEAANAAKLAAQGEAERDRRKPCSWNSSG